jgi:hypothetical protein
MTNVPEPIAKRADQLVVGDRIPDEHLAFRFNQGPAEVVFVAHEAARERDPLPWVFVAYQYPNGRHDSMTIRPEAELQVYPAPAPQPLAERPLVGEGGVWAVPVAGDLVEVDPPEGFVPASARVIETDDGSTTVPGATDERRARDDRDRRRDRRHQACREACSASRFGHGWFDYIAGSAANEWIPSGPSRARPLTSGS